MKRKKTSIKNKDVEYKKTIMENAEIIKEILIKSESKIPVEPFVFFFGAFSISVATIIHFLSRKKLTNIEIFYKIWIPTFIISSIVEFLGWIIKEKKENINLFSKINFNLSISYLVITTTSFFILYFLIKNNLTQYLPATLFFLISITFNLIALITLRTLFYFSIFNLIIGLIETFSRQILIQIFGDYLILFIGFILVFQLIIIGIIFIKYEKR